MQPTAPTKPAFGEATRFWLKLGFISFGGPAGQIAIMHEFLVVRKRWISESRFLHALNYCMLLPGPEAQQLATYTGWLLHGIRGGMVAGLLFILPSIFIMLGVSLLYVTVGNLPWVNALLYGLKPAVVAIVIMALIRIGGKSLLSPVHYVVAVVSFLGIFVFNVPFPFVIISVIGLGLLLQRLAPGWLTARAASNKQVDNESGYYINRDTVLPHTGYTNRRFIGQLLTGIGLWIGPLLLFSAFSVDFAFWKMLSLFFTQAAFVTFGGAYAVLPYVAQVSVESLHWLSAPQMLDGMALGETTPGPLIIILVFVGFMGGYNHFGGSLTAGTLGLFTTTFYTFLPSFLFILAGAPLIERTGQNKSVKALLNLVTAAVVGVILNLTVFLGRSILFPRGLSPANLDPVALGWLLVSLIALYRFRVNVIAWIAVSALASEVYYLISTVVIR